MIGQAVRQSIRSELIKEIIIEFNGLMLLVSFARAGFFFINQPPWLIDYAIRCIKWRFIDGSKQQVSFVNRWEMGKYQ